MTRGRRFLPDQHLNVGLFGYGFRASALTLAAALVLAAAPAAAAATGTPAHITISPTAGRPTAYRFVS